MLPVETVGEQVFMALEPALWSSCRQILQSLVAAAAETSGFSDAWWDEVREGVRATACRRPAPVRLRAKAEFFREISAFAEETEQCGTLQMLLCATSPYSSPRGSATTAVPGRSERLADRGRFSFAPILHSVARRSHGE